MRQNSTGDFLYALAKLIFCLAHMGLIEFSVNESIIK